MKLLKPIKTLFLIAVIILSLDVIYLRTIKNMFEIQIAAVQRVALQLRMLGAVLCYTLLIIGLYYFIIKTRRPIFDAFFLGIVIYGVYETTTYALFKQWKLQTLVIDTLWGGILFALTTWIVYWINDNVIE